MTSRSYSRLYSLAEAGSTAELLDHIAELREENPDDRDPINWALIAAAEANQLETAVALLSAGANVEGATERSHIHPLWKAAKRGHLEMARLLVEHGAKPDAVDNDGMRALDYAKRYARFDVALYLESLT